MKRKWLGWESRSDMKLAAVQYCPPHGNPVLAREQLRKCITKAKGADLIVCPEMAVSGYVFSSREEIAPFVEPAGGASFQMLSELAIALGAWIVCGIAEAHEGQFYNSAITVSPAGELVDVYRKVLLYEQDEHWAQWGERRSIIETRGLGKLCPSICMDLNDDAFAMYIHETQPEVIAFCTNWIEQGLDMLPYWRMRLFGWQGWMVCADRWGEERGTTFYGRSCVLGPGQTVSQVMPAQGDGALVYDTETGDSELFLL